ncbi:hypothetical protein K1719_038159 [Acacia pycnantha]|nr:hypothetical protein K1719_038159 [Acacia pycnantha]
MHFSIQDLISLNPYVVDQLELRDNKHSDIFHAIPWSQGTLGFLVYAEIKPIPIKENMRLTYKPVEGNLKDLAQAFIDTFAPRNTDQDNDQKVPGLI